MNNVDFTMTVSDDLRTIHAVYKGVPYHINYDQYMGEYFATNMNTGKRMAVGRYEYPDTEEGGSSGFCPLPDKEYFGYGFITDMLHHMAAEFAEKKGIVRPKLCWIYNADFGKPFRVGDHYCELCPSMWNIYYRDGAYYYVHTDNEGKLKCKMQFDTENELLEWLEINPFFKTKE